MTPFPAAWAARIIRSPSGLQMVRAAQSGRVLDRSFIPARTFRAAMPRSNKRPPSAVISASGKYRSSSMKKEHPKPVSKPESAHHRQEPTPTITPRPQETVKQHTRKVLPTPATKAMVDQVATEGSPLLEPVHEAAANAENLPQSVTHDIDRSGSVNYAKRLASITEPICVYQAPSQLRYATVCYGSMLFFVAVAKFNYNSVAVFAENNPWALVYAGVICSMYAAIALYCGMAPQKMIRSIYAVPSETGARLSGPEFEITFKPVIPFSKPVQRRFPAVDITRDAPVAATVEQRLSAEAEEQLRFAWGASFFKGVRGVLFDVINMFTRKNLVYLSIPKAGQCKIDLPGAVNLGNGQALEQTIYMDLAKKNLFRKMFS